MRRAAIIASIAFAALVVVSACVMVFGKIDSATFTQQLLNPVSDTAVSPSPQDGTPAEEETPNTINTNQLPDSSFLYDTDMAELNEADSYHDGQTVQIQGEVVGDCINDEADPSVCWITLQDNDDLNPVVCSVILSRENAALIDTYGDYDSVGTQLQVRGTYHLSCTEHQGMSDIHATVVNVIDQGYHSEHEVNAVVFLAALIISVIGIGLFLYYSFKSERSR